MSQKLSSAPSLAAEILEFGGGDVKLDNAFSQDIECHSSQRKRERKLRNKNKNKGKTFILKSETVKANES